MAVYKAVDSHLEVTENIVNGIKHLGTMTTKICTTCNGERFIQRNPYISFCPKCTLLLTDGQFSELVKFFSTDTLRPHRMPNNGSYVLRASNTLLSQNTPFFSQRVRNTQVNSQKKVRNV